MVKRVAAFLADTAGSTAIEYALIAAIISVSGIAYNSAPAERMAIINGVPVPEGKSVSGVKVEEIMPDKVRFSNGQKSFEVLLGRSNQ